jgi:hypothetical protein
MWLIEYETGATTMTPQGAEMSIAIRDRFALADGLPYRSSHKLLAFEAYTCYILAFPGPSNQLRR